MIYRGNWKAVKAYLQYREDADQISKSSLRLEESWLRHLLEWADDQPFINTPKIMPPFPKHMLKSRLDEKDGSLSPEYIRKVISSARRFLDWLSNHRRGYRAITPAWLDTLKSPRQTSIPKDHEAVSLEDMMDIASAPATTTKEKRIQAAVIFLFLSGIRVGAFVTLPLKAINLETRTIYQWPSFGVQTKNQKHATTFLLDIPELMEVISGWDQDVRSVLPGKGYWFAPLSPETGEIDSNNPPVGRHRQSRVRKDLKEWTSNAGLQYYSPHKFRHGNAVFALKKAKDIADFKAISQNLMHSNMSITDGIYGILSQSDRQKRISNLGANDFARNKNSTPEAIEAVESILDQLKGMNS